MRWLWIDAFVAFESGRRASAVKNITLGEDYLADHFPGYPVFPPSLMIEGMAQTAGILVGEARGFRENVILAKVRRAEIEAYAHPGDQLRYDAQLDSLDERAGVTSGTLWKNGGQVGRVDLIFSHVNQAESALDLPEHNFVFSGSFVSLLQGFRAAGRSTDGETHGR